MNSSASCLASARGRASSAACAASRAQIEVGPFEDEPSRLQPRNEEQVVDEAQQPFRASRDDLEVAAALVVEGWLDILERELDVADDRRQRGAEIVGDQSDEFVLELVRLDELVVLQREQHLRLLGIGARRSLAFTQSFEGAQDPDEPQQDEDRDRGSSDHNRERVERRVTEVLDEQHERRAEERCSEQRDADGVHT